MRLSVTLLDLNRVTRNHRGVSQFISRSKRMSRGPAVIGDCSGQARCRVNMNFLKDAFSGPSNLSPPMQMLNMLFAFLSMSMLELVCWSVRYIALTQWDTNSVSVDVTKSPLFKGECHAEQTKAWKSSQGTRVWLSLLITRALYSWQPSVSQKTRKGGLVLGKRNTIETRTTATVRRQTRAALLIDDRGDVALGFWRFFVLGVEPCLP